MGTEGDGLSHEAIAGAIMWFVSHGARCRFAERGGRSGCCFLATSRLEVITQKAYIMLAYTYIEHGKFGLLETDTGIGRCT